MKTTSKDGIKGYKSIWIKFDKDCTDNHQLFFKEHSAKNHSIECPEDRTLFVLNIPPYITPDVLKHSFSKLSGPIQSVTFPSQRGFKNGFIVFEKGSSLEKALSLSSKTTITLNTEDQKIDTGLLKWYSEYNASLRTESFQKKEIEDYMSNYDQKIADRLAKEKAAEEETEDGWTTVTSKKKRGQFAPSRKESTINNIQHKEIERKTKKQLLNFYSFQIRESKKQNLAELRKKFELDKKRLQDLKTARKFKPF